MLMILARLVRSESFWAVVKVRSPHTGPEKYRTLEPRGPRSFPRIAATLRIAGRATRGMPRAPDPGAKTNLRGVAAHAARWGGARQTTGIGFLHSPSLQRAPLQPTRARSRGTQGSAPRDLGN